MQNMSQSTIEERAGKAYNENLSSRVDHWWNYVSVVQLMVKFAQSERGYMREKAAKWCDVQADLAKAVSGPRGVKMLAEERDLAYTIGAEEIRALK